MRLRDRRRHAKRVYDPPRAFRVFVDPDKARNSRWRWKLRAMRSQPPQPYEIDFSAGYYYVSIAEPARLGSFSIV